MVPAALPAFSAPIGVRVVPSWLISDWDRLCAATALATRLRARPQAPMNVFCICILFSPKTGLEAYAEADSGEVAINQSVVLAINEVGVTDAGVVLVGVVRVQADTDRLGVFHEVGAVAFDVMGPGDVRAQVDTGDHVAVIQSSPHTIAPGEVGEVTVVLTPAVGFGCGALGGAAAISKGALAEQGVTTELGRAIAGAQTTDVVEAHLTDQRQTAGAQDAVDEVHGTDRALPELLALVTLDVVTSLNLSGPVAVGVIRKTGSQQQRRAAHVAGVDLQRHVRTVAQLTGNRGTTDVGTEADTVQTDVLRMLEEVAGTTEGHAIVARGQGTAHSTQTRLVGIVGVAAVVVHGVEAELGVVQRRHEPAEGHTELTAVTGILVLVDPGDIGTRGLLAMGQIHASKDQTIITVAAYHIGSGEEGAAVISNGAAPFQLVEGFNSQVLGQALGQIQHLDRHQAFFQFGAGTTEGRGVNRVDRVDTVLDEDTFTPADHLATQTDVTRVLTDEVVVIDEGVKQLDTGPFLERMTSRVVDIIETLTSVLGLEVIPVVATQEGTGVTVAQFKVMGTLEDLGEEIAFLVVQTTIIRCPGCCLPPLIHPVNRCIHVDEALVRVRHRHAGPDGHLGIELPFDCTDIEVYCVCRATEAGQPDCERQCGQRPSMLCFCHCAAPLGWIQTPGCLGSQTVAISVSWSICPVCLHRTDHLAGPDIQGLNVMDLSPLYSCNCLL